MKTKIALLIILGAILFLTRSSSEFPKNQSLKNVLTGAVNSSTPSLNLKGTHNLEHQASQSHDAAQIQKSTVLVRKALLSQDESRALQHDLSNPQLISEAFALLANNIQDGFSLENQNLRLALVDWIKAALYWKENPERKILEEMTIDYLSKDFSQKILSRVHKKSHQGDQIELFMIFARSHPQRAKEIYASLQGTPQGDLVAYAINFDLTQNLKGRIYE